MKVICVERSYEICLFTKRLIFFAISHSRDCATTNKRRAKNQQTDLFLTRNYRLHMMQTIIWIRQWARNAHVHTQIVVNRVNCARQQYEWTL